MTSLFKSVLSNISCHSNHWYMSLLGQRLLSSIGHQLYYQISKLFKSFTCVLGTVLSDVLSHSNHSCVYLIKRLLLKLSSIGRQPYSLIRCSKPFKSFTCVLGTVLSDVLSHSNHSCVYLIKRLLLKLSITLL